jgi:hypothetical protein
MAILYTDTVLLRRSEYRRLVAASVRPDIAAQYRTKLDPRGRRVLASADYWSLLATLRGDAARTNSSLRQEGEV